MSALAALCGGLGLDVPSGWPEYLEIAEAWAARTDLAGGKNDAERCEVLFLDAAQLVKASWTSPGRRLVDVGAGVGAPTLPYVLASPSAEAVLVEPRRRRVAFLRTAIGSLGLADRVRVIEGRVDPTDPIVDGMPFDVALSRATFDPATWFAIGSALAREVWILAARRPSVGARATPIREVTYRVPSTGAPRSVVAFVRASSGVSDDGARE